MDICSNSPTRTHNRNPKGKNQYTNCPVSNDPRVLELLKAYDRQGIANRKVLSNLFLSEHGIKIRMQIIDTTIVRRRRELGLKASRVTTKELPDSAKRQLVLDQMAKDPTGKQGPRTIKQGIFRDTGIHLTRDWIANEMRKIDPEAYASRGPAHNKGRRHAVSQSNDSQIGDEDSSQQSNDNENVDNPAALTNAAPLPMQYRPRDEFGYRSAFAAAIGSTRMASSTSGHHPMAIGPVAPFSNSGNDEDDGYTPDNTTFSDPDTNPAFSHQPNAVHLNQHLPQSTGEVLQPPTVFDALHSATPQLLALQQALHGSEVRDERDVEIVMRFREQLQSLLQHLPHCP